MRVWPALVRMLFSVALASASIDCVPPPPAQAPMPAGATWAGKWDTTWGPLELTQNGTSVSGTYAYKSVRGTLTGSMDQNHLRLDWRESEGGAGSGKGLFVMGADARSFTGSWGSGASDSSGGSWNGTRIGEAPASAAPVGASPEPAPAAAPAATTPAAAAPAAGSDGVATCGGDGECPTSTHCKAGRCTAECSGDAHCGAEKRCDAARGRCVPR